MCIEGVGVCFLLLVCFCSCSVTVPVHVHVRHVTVHVHVHVRDTGCRRWPPVTCSGVGCLMPASHVVLSTCLPGCQHLLVRGRCACTAYVQCCDSLRCGSHSSCVASTTWWPAWHQHSNGSCLGAGVHVFSISMQPMCRQDMSWGHLARVQSMLGGVCRACQQLGCTMFV